MYSYIDPVGSFIEVKYTMNRDKTNYIEERKVIKNYVSSGGQNRGGLTIEQVVERVLTDIRPTVIQVIRSTVQGSSVDLTSQAARRQLVQMIIVQMRPVVFKIVTEVLAETGTNYLDAEELTDMIVVELTPVIEQGVNEEANRVQQASAAQQGQIIQKIITDLKPSIIRIIQATVSSSDVDLSNIDGLLRTILVQLKPVVLNEVQNALKTSNFNFNANTMSDKIIVEITPFVRQALQQEVQNQVGNLEDRVVTQVITDLKPTVIRIVQATVSSSNVDIGNTNQLIETIIVQLRPVVLREVQNALATSPYPLNAQTLTERIVVQLRPFVGQALEQEVAKLTSQVQNQVVGSIQADVASVIKNTVNSASVIDLENPQALVDQILARLRPIVLEAVKRALQGSSINLDPQSLVVKVIIQLTPDIQTGVQQQVQVAKDQQIQALYDEIVATIPPRMSGIIGQKVSVLMAQGDSQSLPDSVLIDRIIGSLQGDVIGAIEADSRFRVVVNSSGFTQLMQRIMAALRPIILQEIQYFRSTQTEPPRVVVQQPSGDLSSIFGLGGKNTVRVETPDIKYGYETK